MRVAAIVALLSAPFLALAQQANPFKIPSSGLAATGGQPLTLNWTPTTQGTVSLVLRSGSSNDLNKGTVIASSIPNSGSYTWTPSNSLTRGSDYAIEIVDDSDPSKTNYTPYFVLDTTNTVSSNTGVVTEGATKTTLTSQTGVQTSGSSSGSSSGSAASTSSGSSAASTSGSMMTSGAASSSTPGASFQNTAAGGSSTSVASGNSGARATAAAGMLGLVAMGALAL